MPYYDYRCKNCSKTYTYLHLGSEDKIPTCPDCASQAAEQQVSKTGGHILKGGGWFYSDYPKKRQKNQKP